MRLALLVVLFGFAAGLAVPTYPEGRPSDPFGGATLEAAELNPGLAETWRVLREQLYLDNLRISACVEFSKVACPPVSKLLEVVEEARQQQGKALLGHLNRSINLTIHPVPGDWTTALDAFERGMGDCKVYSVAKYVALLWAGIPIERLRLVIVYNRHRSVEHMIVTVYQDHDWLILDNLTMALVKDIEQKNYEPMFVLDDMGVRSYIPSAQIGLGDHSPEVVGSSCSA